MNANEKRVKCAAGILKKGCGKNKIRPGKNGNSPGPDKNVVVSVVVRRPSYGVGKKSFEACAFVGTKGFGAKGTKTYGCAAGKNPRKAIGAALKKAGMQIAKRAGAFAGLGNLGGPVERRRQRIIRSARRHKRLRVK